jgi:hypothetical protein
MRLPDRLRAGAMISALTVLLALTPTAVHAQVLIGFLFGEKLSSETFNMGFEVGMNFATLNGMKGADRMNQGVFGLFADWRFSEHVHFGGSILPVSARGAKGLDPVLTGDPAFDAQVANGTMERKLSYVDIPLLLRFAPQREKGLRIGAGPQIGFRTGATDRYHAKTATGLKFTAERNIKGKTAGVDVGISADVEYRLKMLSIGVRYTHGLTDLDESPGGGKVHNRVVTGTGRIYLGKQK